jgi:ComF family protein
LPDRAALLGRLARRLNTWLPRRCPGCHAQLGSGAGLCPACQALLRPRVERHSPLRERPTPHLLTLGDYRGPLRRAISELKFRGSRELAELCADEWAAQLPAAWQVGVVSGASLHPGRARQRGFDQTELLACALAARLGVPAPTLLRRTRPTQQQARLSGSQRAANLGGAFEAALHVDCPILLVDDVLTTGATLRAATQALTAAGMGPVYYAVIAR